MASKVMIPIKEETKKKLDELKKDTNESYDLLLKKLIEFKKKIEENEYFDKIQEEKMKELWDNEEDEVWENV